MRRAALRRGNRHRFRAIRVRDTVPHPWTRASLPSRRGNGRKRKERVVTRINASANNPGEAPRGFLDRSSPEIARSSEARRTWRLDARDKCASICSGNAPPAMFSLIKVERGFGNGILIECRFREEYRAACAVLSDLSCRVEGNWGKQGSVDCGFR